MATPTMRLNTGAGQVMNADHSWTSAYSSPPAVQAGWSGQNCCDGLQLAQHAQIPSYWPSL
jgi:hypothetical protein